MPRTTHFHIVFALAIAGWACCVCAETTEPPVYGGKTADQWTAILTEHLDGESVADKETCRKAAAALGQIGPAAVPAVEALADALQSPSLEVRDFAVDALGRIGPVAISAVPAIITEMDLPPDHVNYRPLAKFRRTAARALGRIGPEATEAVPLLEKTLNAEDSLYQVQAALALWKISQKPRSIELLASMLAKSEPDAAYEAAMALGEIGPDAVAAQIQLMDALGHQQIDVRRASADTLVRLGTEVIEPVSSRIQQGSLKSPAEAAYVLGAVISPLRREVMYASDVQQSEFDGVAGPALRFAVPALLGLLSDSRESVRQAAQRSLSQIGILIVPKLLEVIGTQDGTTQQAAIDTLIRIEAFLPPAGTNNPRLTSLRGLLLKRLIANMTHEKAAVRAAVFRAFAEMSFGVEGREALPLLRRALKDENLAVRRYASQAIRDLDGE